MNILKSSTFIIILCFFLNVKSQNSSLDLISQEDKVIAVSKFWSEVKNNFVNYDQLNFSWDSIYLSSLEAAIKAEGDFEFLLILKKMAATLNDGHTEILPDSYFAKYTDCPGIYLKRIKDTTYVIKVRKKLINDVPLGSIIVGIDNYSMDNYLIQKAKYVCAGSCSTKLYLSTENLCGDKISPLILKIITPEGQEKNVTINRDDRQYYQDTTNPYFGYDGALKKWPIDFRWLKDSVGYLGIHSFLEDVRVEMLQNIDSSYKAKGLIIDLRYNRGGSTTIAKDLLFRIINQNYFLSYISEVRSTDPILKALGYRNSNSDKYYNDKAYRFEKQDTIYVPSSIKRLNIPIIILISNNTFSAAEDFLLMLAEIPNRPIFIGTETGGSTGLPLVIKLCNHINARICVRRQYYPHSFKLFKGNGIFPDIIKTRTLKSYIENDDNVLYESLIIMQKLIKNKDKNTN